MLSNFKAILHCLATHLKEFLLLQCLDSWYEPASFLWWEVSKCPRCLSSAITQPCWQTLPLIITLLLAPAAPALRLSWRLRPIFPYVVRWLRISLLHKILTERAEQACNVQNCPPVGWLLSPLWSCQRAETSTHIAKVKKVTKRSPYKGL